MHCKSYSIGHFAIPGSSISQMSCLSQLKFMQEVTENKGGVIGVEVWALPPDRIGIFDLPSPRGRGERGCEYRVPMSTCGGDYSESENALTLPSPTGRGERGCGCRVRTTTCGGDYSESENALTLPSPRGRGERGCECRVPMSTCGGDYSESENALTLPSPRGRGKRAPEDDWDACYWSFIILRTATNSPASRR